MYTFIIYIAYIKLSYLHNNGKQEDWENGRCDENFVLECLNAVFVLICGL